MTNFRFTVLFLIAAVLLGGCSGKDKFRISGDTADGRELTLRIVIYSPEGVKREVLATQSGHFEYEDVLPDSKLPVFIELYSHDYTLLGLAEAFPSSELSMTLDSRGISHFRVNDDKYDDPDSFVKRLNAWLSEVGTIDNDAVSEFVRNNSDNPAAYAVLTTLFNATAAQSEMRELLASLAPEARPAYYDNGIATIVGRLPELPNHLEPDTLLCAADTFFYFDPADYKEILIAFDLDNNDRKDSISPLLQKLATDGVKKRLVMEQSLVPDSSSWRRSLRNDIRNFKSNNEKEGAERIKDDKIHWVSVWTGVGPAAPFADRFNITQLPYFVVADSAAVIQYAGPSASRAHETLIDIHKQYVKK